MLLSDAIHAAVSVSLVSFLLTMAFEGFCCQTFSLQSARRLVADNLSDAMLTEASPVDVGVRAVVVVVVVVVVVLGGFRGFTSTATMDTQH